MLRFLLKATAVTAVLTLVITAAVLISFNLASKDDQSVETTASPLYTLGVYDGRVALYKRNFSMPVEIYDVYLDTLPEADRGLIENGIYAYSDEEAERLIEDYTS
ncbi:MAG: hypothetical protein E7514_07560 [Ruminococcaceae bacterium]|nr:hypothetical protein [Oscillospiraceae bacterium]